ncbi:V-type ATP synthase subunit D [candidate division KSB1 bacterium]|nr:V-type ATP synthase subunit D [candidate division KSB1 bacterium]
MAKVRLTKNELKKQKDNLKRFTRYLPTLELKKKQLLMEIRKIQNEIELLQEENRKVERDVSVWVGVFAEEIDLTLYIQVTEIRTSEGNIAGIEIPIFEEVIFEEALPDVFTTPLWIDRGIEVLKEQIRRQAQWQIAEKQQEIVRNELRTTIQRIKLFEEVKIPEARNAIRTIQIFMGDQMTAEVVRGKIAKTKIQRKKEMSAA